MIKVAAGKSKSQETNKKELVQKSKRFIAKKQKENCKANKLSALERYGTNRTTRSSRREKEKGSPPRQCLGPGCVNPAQTNSKYCSNECGVQLQIR